MRPDPKAGAARVATHLQETSRFGEASAPLPPHDDVWLPAKLAPGLEHTMMLPEASHWISYDGYEPQPLAWIADNVKPVVLPSRTMPPLREQFGLVLAEAMLSGVTVIGSDSGAIPEVIGDDGLIFPEGDHQALADQTYDLYRQLMEKAER